MKQAIIVAPQFPPSNLTAGHRARYFAMHLPKFGWKVKVLSVKPHFYEESLDHELEKLLPPDLEIIRTNAMPVKPLRLIGDIGVRAFLWHYRQLCRLAKEEKPDIIYIPIPPNYSALLGGLIYKKFGIPYAIDYIDPWVHPWPGCEKLFSKAWLSYNFGRFLEPIALKHASLITAVAPAYYQGVLKRYAWLDKIPCSAMPYGAEERDFKYLDSHPRPTYIYDSKDGNLHIVYAGAMLPRAYSTLEALCKAMHKLKEREPSVARKLRFHFIGTGPNPETFNVIPYAKQYNLTDIIIEHPSRIPYLDVLNHLRQSHAVLILGSSESHYTPSKVFQAILAHRPILAFLHSESTAVNILKEADMNKIVSFDEKKPVEACVDEITKAIKEIVDYKYLPGEIDWQAFKKYSAEAVTEKLARAFDNIAKSRDSGKHR